MSTKDKTDGQPPSATAGDGLQTPAARARAVKKTVARATHDKRQSVTAGPAKIPDGGDPFQHGRRIWPD